MYPSHCIHFLKAYLPYVINSFWKSLRLEDSAWDFGGLYFWSREFFFFGGGGLIVAPHSIIPIT